MKMKYLSTLRVTQMGEYVKTIQVSFAMIWKTCGVYRILCLSSVSQRGQGCFVTIL